MHYVRPAQIAGAENLRARFEALHALVAAEVEGLSQPRLDFTSEQWAWSRWSIRRQLGHMASVFFSWLFNRWGDGLFEGGPPPWYRAVEAMPDRLQFFMEGEAVDLLQHIRDGITVTLGVIQRESAESMRGSRQISVQIGGGWKLMSKAHPAGVVEDPSKPGLYHMTLEGTLRHVYYENLTHLYNVQRLKLAQGLPTHVDVPFEGYHALDGWDRSEP